MRLYRCVRRAIFFTYLALAVCANLSAAAQTAPPPEQAPSPPSSAQAPSPPAAPAAKKETSQYTLSREKYEKAVAYSRAEYTLYFVSFFYGVAVLLILLRAGVPAKFRDIAESASDKRLAQLLVFVPLLILTLDILDLPARIYGHSLSVRYEQSIQGWGSWFWDWTKAELLGVFFSVILAGILFGVMRRSPRRWWFYFWLATLPIVLFLIFISPWFIDPLFYKFEPLDAKHADLVTAIEKVVHRAGMDIPRERMFLMDASQKTRQLNAYVTGFGASKRVVVWDNTIADMTTDETLFVFAHEMGHYVLGHIRDGFLFFAVVLLLAFYLAFRGLHGALDRWGTAWRIHTTEDWASLAVMLLILSVFLFFASPVINGFTRMQEHNADVYGLEVIHGIVPDSAETAAHAFQVMGEVDLSDPNPPAFVTFWLYSHPPVADRLVFARTYDPWAKHEPPKYVK